ncbi:MAG: DUF3568 family protein [Planctomycetota bacterium]|jgi:hypothetical protein
MRAVLLGLAVGILMMSSGCLMLLGGGTAGVRELTDKVVTYQGTVDQVEAACRKTLKERGGMVKEVSREEKKGGKRTLRGKTYDGVPITIDMEPISPKEVEVEVRVGRIGSKSRAETFHATLMKHLKAVL